MTTHADASQVLAVRAPRAFTLLEVLVAGALFLVGTAAVLGGWRSILVSMDQQRRSTEAVALADDVLDDLRLRPRDHADLDVGAHSRFFTRLRKPSAAAVADGYRVDWTVHGSNGQTFRRIDVVVRWRGTDRREHALPFPTFRPTG